MTKNLFKPRSIVGCMFGMAEAIGDIVSPIDVEWDVMKNDCEHDRIVEPKKVTR